MPRSTFKRMIDAASLAEIELFSKLDETELEQLASTMSERTFPPNRAVVWVGDPASEFFIIRTGSVEVCVPEETGRELRVAVLGPGEHFGELALFDRGTRSTTVRTITEVRLIVLSHEAFYNCMRRYPSMAIHVLEILGRRQRMLLEKLRGIRNLNEIIQQRLTTWQRVASFIAETAASRGFLLTHACLFSTWIGANALLGSRAWDPYPFLFLCFWASVEAIFLSLFILVSQATQSQKDRLRNEQDYQVAVKLQFEIMQMHQKLDALTPGGAPRPTLVSPPPTRL